MRRNQAANGRVRRHGHIADQVFAGKIDTHDRDLNAELIFLHFRKALEEIAFASLSAKMPNRSCFTTGVKLGIWLDNGSRMTRECHVRI